MKKLKNRKVTTDEKEGILSVNYRLGDNSHNALLGIAGAYF